MKRTLIVLALLALGLAAPAAAKGPDKATVTGPGLEKPLVFRSNGDPEPSTRFGTLVEAVGLIPAVFEQTPNPMLARKPAGALGPRYRVVYRVPGPNDERDEIVQDVYPYATDGPVSYLEPGQRIFGGDHRTHGGWFAASATLRDDLIALGFPKRGPEAADSSARGRTWSLLATLLGGVR